VQQRDVRQSHPEAREFEKELENGFRVEDVYTRKEYPELPADERRGAATKYRSHAD
jgi:hypothetical protein